MINSREVGADPGRAVERAVLCERRYEGSCAPEIFLSFETADEAQTLCGFLRLRLPQCRRSSGVGEQEMYTPLRSSTDCSKPLPPGALSYTPVKDGAARAAAEAAGGERERLESGETAIEHQVRVRALERRDATVPGGGGGSGAGTEADEVVSAFPELEGCALIRELHVYGKLVVSRPS